MPFGSVCISGKFADDWMKIAHGGSHARGVTAQSAVRMAGGGGVAVGGARTSSFTSCLMKPRRIYRWRRASFRKVVTDLQPVFSAVEFARRFRREVIGMTQGNLRSQRLQKCAPGITRKR